MFARILLTFLACIICCGAMAQEFVYRGTWKTTNRPLDGEMTCVVTPVAKEAWQGRFIGVWQGLPFDYTVDFVGPAYDLQGTATIDRAAYEWRGRIQRDRFKANFTGDRYEGSFDLRRSPDRT